MASPSGPVFGVLSGLAHGLTLGWEFSRASRGAPRPGIFLDAVTSGIRGLGFGLGTAYLYGAAFGVAFGLLSTAGQLIAYRFGIRPTIDYKPATRPRVTRFQLLAALNRSVGYAAAGYLSSVIARERDHALAVGLKVGLAMGVVTTAAIALTPFIEWTADRIPERRMGVFGIGLILAGFSLQSVQYWVAFLDVPVR